MQALSRAPASPVAAVLLSLASGWAALEPPGTQDPRREVPVDLESVLRGRVVESATGEGIAGAEILEAGGGPVSVWRPYLPPLATTDSAGRFELPSPGHVTSFWVDAPGFGPVIFEVPAHPDETPERVLALRPSAALVSLVSPDQPDPEGLSVRVSLPMKELRVPPSRGDSYRSDVRWGGGFEERGCRIDGLPARIPLVVELLVRGKPWRRPPRPLVLEPGECAELVWDLELPATLGGRLADAAGEPLAGVTLWLWRNPFEDPGQKPVLLVPAMKETVFDTAVTGADGSFRFDAVPSGWWWVGPEAREPAASDVCSVARPVHVPAGSVGTRVHLVAYRGTTLEGRMLAPDGQPCAGLVFATSDQVDAFLMARAGDDGRFRFSPVPPFELSLVAHGRPHAPSEPALVVVGESSVELHLRVGAAIAGRVVDGRTGSPARASLTITGPDDDAVLYHAGAAEDGKLTLDGLEPGAYDLAATTPDGQVGVRRGVVVERGDQVEGIEILVEPAGLAHVRYVGSLPKGELTLYCGTTAIAFEGLATGTSATHSVPPGRVRAVLRFGEERFERWAEVEAGELVEILFDLP